MERSFWTELLDFLSPRRCAGCGNRLSATESVFCHECWWHMPLTHYEDNALENRMARTFWGLLPMERAAALFFYEPNTEMANMIHAVKYFDRPDLAENMGRIVAVRFAKKGFFETVDAMVPVPLSPDRLKQRGYNQSEMIARGIGEVTAIPIYNKVLARRTFQGSQTRLNPFERRDNVEHAFVLSDGSQLTGKHLLLVDDVMTTGSTLLACGELLAQQKGVKVSILTLGYTSW